MNIGNGNKCKPLASGGCTVKRVYFTKGYATKNPGCKNRGCVVLKSIFYTLKWAKALLASAILCVSSFFLNAEPSPLLAATISPASLSAMVLP